jgi:hypothetical protein
VPEEPAVAALLKECPGFATKMPLLAPFLSKLQPGFSYTQWEAYLALYHGRPLFVYRPIARARGSRPSFHSQLCRSTRYWGGCWQVPRSAEQ